MHRTNAAAVILLPALTVAMSACGAGEAASFSAADAAGVRANLDRYMELDPADQPEEFFSEFTEDVYWAYDDRSPWVGIEGLRNVDWCHTRSGAITAEHVDGSGELAYARGTYSLALDCGDESLVEREGIFLSVHRRQGDGSWRIESFLQND